MMDGYKIFDFSNCYTRTPFARNKEHDEQYNGEDFKNNYLLKWINNKEKVLIIVDGLELPFSDSFVDASFCNVIRKDKKLFDKYIKIRNETNDEFDLHVTIKEVLDNKLPKTIIE